LFAISASLPATERAAMFILSRVRLLQVYRQSSRSGRYWDVALATKARMSSP